MPLTSELVVVMQHREGEVMQGTLDQERKGQAGRGRPFLQWKPLHCVNMHSCSSLLVPPTILSILITPAPRTLLSPRTYLYSGRSRTFPPQCLKKRTEPGPADCESLLVTPRLGPPHLSADPWCSRPSAALFEGDCEVPVHLHPVSFS